jgi:ABC-type multidrug transport system fused ATPase/permease subunit
VDKIIVMDDGKIAEMGTFPELMEAGILLFLYPTLPL